MATTLRSSASAPVETVLARLKGVRRNGSGWMALCPAHEDGTASLSIDEGEGGRALVCCFAGCPVERIVKVIGLELRDLMPPESPARVLPLSRIVATYDYRSDDDALLYQVVRYEPKNFKQRRPDPAAPDGWSWKTQGVRRVLYRLSAVVEAVAEERTVFLVEGEKDADRLTALGVCATTNAGGAGKWRDEYSATLHGAGVVILPDYDDAGRAHAAQVAASLLEHDATVRVVELPRLPAKGDVSDWLRAGGTIEALHELVAATPLCRAEDVTAAPVQSTDDDATADLPAAQPAAQLHVVTLSDVAPRAVTWLWPGYLPIGKLVVVDGFPGQGKSTLMLDIAARLSRGAAMPDGTRSIQAPSDTILLSYEDDARDTIAPRLLAAHGDPTRVHVVTGVSYNGDPDVLPPSLPKDIAALAAELEARPDVRLVVIDPLAAALSADVDSHRDQDVRRPLARLARLAEARNVCIVIVRHVRKSAGSNAITAGGGSVGIIGQARVGLLVDRHPDDDQAAVLAVSKSNVAAIPASLKFTKVAATLQTAAGETIATSRLEWAGDAKLSADELLAAHEDGTQGESSDATDWLHHVLSESPVERRNVMTAARSAGYPDRTIDRAAKRLGVVKNREGFGAACRALWSLPTGPDASHLRHTFAHSRHTAEVAHVAGVAEVESAQRLEQGALLVDPSSPEEAELLARLERERSS